LAQIGSHGFKVGGFGSKETVATGEKNEGKWRQPADLAKGNEPFGGCGRLSFKYSRQPRRLSLVKGVRDGEHAETGHL
jgi:hypothetical protein